MVCQMAMELLSQCGLGALLLLKNGEILSVNETGDRLLHGEGKLAGTRLPSAAAPLCEETTRPIYANIAFGEYLIRCTSPELSDLPQHSRLVVFRDATNDARHDMLVGVLKQISESVILCDAENRMVLMNDAAVRLESIVTQDVLGEDLTSVYNMRDGAELMVPQVIRDKRPILNRRQYYTTRYGKDMDIVSNNFPIVQNGQILGGFSVIEDWKKIDVLHQQIIELQDKLVRNTTASRKMAKSALEAKYRFQDIVHVSAVMGEAVSRCKQVAKSDSSVMIYGEMGTGKELFAQSIHNASSRARGPFLAISCATIPENLLESLLFGMERGAYTGAERRPGLFEQANTGTLLLDEINAMSINLQSKLLRTLQDGIIRRVGGTAEIHVDVRVLFNLSLPPYQAIAENKLHRDFFYCLGVIKLNIPPLRERKEDIALLVKHFIMLYNKKMAKNVKDIDNATLEKFCAYSWPGNVRELQYAIEHTMSILPDGISTITPKYIPGHRSPQAVTAAEPPQIPEGEDSLSSTIQGMERRAICKALQDSGGNISAAARILKMSRQNLQYHVKRYGIDALNLRRSARGGELD